MSEDKNLNGVMDSEESNPGGINDVILNEVELDEMTEALIETGEANGSGTSEAAEASESEVEVSDEAPAEAESETEESVDEVVEEVVPLPVVYFTFDEDKDKVDLVVDIDFQLKLRELCVEQNARPTEFIVEGDISVESLRILKKALK